MLQSLPCSPGNLVLLNWAWTTASTVGSSKLVLLALAHLADPRTGVARASTGLLGTMTGLARSAVQRQIRALEQQGLIRTEHHGGGRGNANAYRIVADVPATGARESA